jgi:hypothetical protein
LDFIAVDPHQGKSFGARAKRWRYGKAWSPMAAAAWQISSDHPSPGSTLYCTPILKVRYAKKQCPGVWKPNSFHAAAQRQEKSLTDQSALA